MTLIRGPWIWSFFFLWFSSAAFGVSLNYVSPQARAHLQKEFDTHLAPVPGKLDGLWTCEMIGMRTGLQHEKGLPLYEFVPQSKNLFKNKGAAPNSIYSLSSQGRELTGSGEKVTETLHFVSENELIARMTHTKSEEIVAFAHCRRDARSLTQRQQSIETIATHD